MKGIAGIAYPDVFQVNHLIFPMLDVIQQVSDPVRDFHTSNNIQIGTAGSMLAKNEKKTIIGGVDGTIYNIKEVEKELIKQGYHFQTNNPTEILVHAYELWDTRFLEKIEGDFALMILDPLKKRLIIARDRIGKKPVFWFHSHKHFIFATQLKALIATGVVPQAPAPDALAAYLYLGYFPQDLTPLKDVNKLLPGHYLQYNFNQSKTIEPFWSYSSYFEHPLKKHKNTIAHNLETRLEHSVNQLLPKNDVGVGCFVSGGLGSASIAYYVSKALKEKKPDCFTVGFKGENDEDVEAAAVVAKQLGLAYKTEYITPSTFLDNLVNIVWHLDEPIADPNIVAIWKQAELAAETTKVVFSGMGCDELLAGHNRYTVSEHHVNMLSRLYHLQTPFIYHVLVPLMNLIYTPWAYKLLKQTKTNPWQHEYIRNSALFDDDMIAKASPQLSGLFDPDVFLHKFHNLSRVKSTVSSFLYFDVKTRLVDNYMTQVGRLTDANNLIWQTPFLDQKLVQFLASMPDIENLAESDTATFLKTLMKGVFPNSFVARPKKTRSHFLASWINQSDMAEVCLMLENGTLVETGVISREWLKQSLSTPERRLENFKYLWAVLILEIWFQLMINRPVTYTPPNISVRELFTKTKILIHKR